MTSLLISKLGRQIADKPPAAAVAELQRSGLLSETALAQLGVLRSMIEKIEADFRREPPTGEEIWSLTQEELKAHGFLSLAGLQASQEFVPRIGPLR